MVLDELCATEEDYARDLRTLSTMWRPGLEAAGLLPAPADGATLFGTIPQLEFLAGELLREMRAVRERPLAEQRLGEVLLKKLPFLRLYIEHCSEHSRAMALLERLAADARFVEFQDRVMREKEAVRHIDLAGFLIKPTQRITRYPLLIKDIIRLTEEDHPDYEKLVQVGLKLRGILDEINEKTRIQESVDLFLSVQPVMRWTNKPYDLVASRTLNYTHGRIRWELICPTISPEPLARGNYVFVTSHFILACNERFGQYIELATFMVHKISLGEQDPTGHDVTVSISRGDGAPEVLVIHAGDFLEHQSWFTALKTCRNNAPAQPAQLVEMAAYRRQTADNVLVPPIRIPSTRSEGTASPPIGSEEHRQVRTTREAYMTLRASRTTSSPNRFTVTTTFKDDSVLQPTSPRSDASVHRPQPKHVRTRSALFRSTGKEESPPPSSQQHSSPLSSSPPPTASAPQPLSEDTTDADAATAADSPQAGTSHKHKHKSSSSSSRKSKSKSKLKAKEVPVTRARSNDVVLVPPTPVQEDTPLPSQQIHQQQLWGTCIQSMSAKIYTRAGDDGTSGTLRPDGQRLPKSDVVFDALGTVDELSSHIGLARSALRSGSATDREIDTLLERAQTWLHECGAALARGGALSGAAATATRAAEAAIDALSEPLAPLRGFVLPGGCGCGDASARCHVARSVCRRAERCCVAAAADPSVVALLNRLSDLLFVCARALCEKEAAVAVSAGKV